jgi:DNA repair exonuclease SbcCD ATPase subunit
MALNLKDLSKKSGTAKKAGSALTEPSEARPTARPWEIEPWEKTADSGQGDDSETAPDAAVALEAELAAASATTEESPAQSAAASDSIPDEVELADSDSEGSSAVAPATEDADIGLDDVLAFVEELKFKLKNSQKSKLTLEEGLAVARTRMEEMAALAEARAREIKQIKQELARVRGENERLLAEMCRADEDRAEAAREIQRLGLGLKESKTHARSFEDQIAKSRIALLNARRLAETRAQQAAASDAEHAQRWRKFEEQLNQKDRDLLEARASMDELRHLKEQAEARIARLEGSRAAIAKLRSAVQSVRDRRTGDSET